MKATQTLNTLLVLLVMMLSKHAFANSDDRDTLYLGTGFGGVYGGLGFKLAYKPIEQISIHTSGGVSWVGLSYSYGLSYHLPLNKSVNPYVIFHAGRNLVLSAESEDGSHWPGGGTYNGAVTGIGVELGDDKLRAALETGYVISKSKELFKERDLLEQSGFHVEGENTVRVRISIGLHYYFFLKKHITKVSSKGPTGRDAQNARAP